jgi:hypothetical protein
VNNIKIELSVREIGWDDMDWIDLAQDRDHLKALLIHKMLGRFLSGCTIGGFSRGVQLRK